MRETVVNKEVYSEKCLFLCTSRTNKKASQPSAVVTLEVSEVDLLETFSLCSSQVESI